MSLTIGATLALLDLDLRVRRRMWKVLEDLAMLQVGGGRLIDVLAQAGLVAVGRDGFGDIVKITWRTDASTVMQHAVTFLVADRRIPRSEPLPNMRLKLAGASKYGRIALVRPSTPSRSGRWRARALRARSLSAIR